MRRGVVDFQFGWYSGRPKELADYVRYTQGRREGSGGFLESKSAQTSAIKITASLGTECATSVVAAAVAETLDREALAFLEYTAPRRCHVREGRVEEVVAVRRRGRISVGVGVAAVVDELREGRVARPHQRDGPRVDDPRTNRKEGGRTRTRKMS